jgi:integrase
VIPLAPAAAAILEAVPRLSDTLVFVGFSSWSYAKKALDAAAPLATAWVVHDLRRSCGTHWREQLGADPHLCELALNHISGSRGGVAGIYDRSERLAERHRLVERWGDLVLHAAGEAVPPATVVNLR